MSTVIALKLGMGTIVLKTGTVAVMEVASLVLTALMCQLPVLVLYVENAHPILKVYITKAMSFVAML